MKIACFGDTHFPFHDRQKLAQAIEVAVKFKPDAVIQVGDATDQFAFSKYPKNPSACRLTPQQQIDQARNDLLDFWGSVKKKMPKAQRIQLVGNHDVRAVRRAHENAPELSFIVEDWFRYYMTIPGVQTVPDEFVLDGVMFMHGYKKMGDHARYNCMNTVTGHVHKARIEYFQNAHGTYWEFNVGWLGDKKSRAFDYRSQKKIDDTQTGVGLIENGQPRFVML